MSDAPAAAASTSLPPFACTHTPEFPALLARLGCSLALSTYQAGKVIFLSPSEDGGTLTQLPRQFDKPMGLAVSADGRRMAVATRNEVVVLANEPRLARAYPDKPDHYDALFIPRAVFFAGELDLHDLAFAPAAQNAADAADTLWAVNTRFSCLGRIDARYSFTPWWRPAFITDLAPDDRCHLNGLALDETTARPAYATALGQADAKEGWRARLLDGGLLFQLADGHGSNGEPILRGLPMPHSPRLYDGRLFLLLSAVGELVTLDPASGARETVARLPGFARGLARCGEFVFVGISLLRKTHRFAGLPIAGQAPFCGVVAVHLPSGRTVGHVQYLNSCEEIYDVQVLPGTRRPGIVRVDHPFRYASLSLPEDAFWSQPAGSPS